MGNCAWDELHGGKSLLFKQCAVPSEVLLASGQITAVVAGDMFQDMCERETSTVFQCQSGEAIGTSLSIAQIVFRQRDEIERLIGHRIGAVVIVAECHLPQAAAQYKEPLKVTALFPPTLSHAR